MPWLFVPEHQQPWYWPCKIGRSLSFTRNNLTTCVLSVWRNDMNWEKNCAYFLRILQCKVLRMVQMHCGNQRHSQGTNPQAPDQNNAWVNSLSPFYDMGIVIVQNMTNIMGELTQQFHVNILPLAGTFHSMHKCLCHEWSHSHSPFITPQKNTIYG